LERKAIHTRMQKLCCLYLVLRKVVSFFLLWSSKQQTILFFLHCLCISLLKLPHQILQIRWVNDSTLFSQSSGLEVKAQGIRRFRMFLFVFVFFFFFRAAPTAYGGSQAKGRIGAAAAGLHHSHSSARLKPRLRPTPQLTATQDP